MSIPILSIVIPTRNRYGTLKVVADAIMAWQSDDFELVIHDNSEDNQGFHETVQRYGSDPRFNYIHTPEHLTLVENSGCAIGAAKGEYICFIGDDDGLIPATIRLCHWLNDNGFDTATFDRPQYIWPDLTALLKQDTMARGTLTTPVAVMTARDVDVQSELRKFVTAGVTNVHYQGPNPYNGLARRQIYEEAFAATGHYFPAPTPDVAATISSSLFSKRHAHICIPCICGGQSSNSAAGLGRQGKHVGEIKDIKSLPHDTDAKWAAALPKFWSGFTINAESAIKTLEAFGEKDLLKAFNYNRNIAACLVYLSNAYRRRTLAHIMNKPDDAGGKFSALGVLAQIPVIFWLRLHGLVRRKRRQTTHALHLDIREALDSIQQQVEEQYPSLALNSDAPIPLKITS